MRVFNWFPSVFVPILLLWNFGILPATSITPLNVVNLAEMCMKFLHLFGYVNDSAMDMEEGEKKEHKIESALKMYQKYVHVNVTGQMDLATVGMMMSPRCGNKDDSVVIAMEHGADNKREKRYCVDSKWEKPVIIYRFKNYARCCISPEQIEEEFKTAATKWTQAVTPHLKLIPASTDTEEVDIEIEFTQGPHHDNMSFAEMNTVAHAFYPKQTGNHPIRGDIHFNNDVNWTSGPTEKQEAGSTDQNFLQTCCHELGHSLGLKHSVASDAVMYHAVEGYNPNFKLHDDDREGIQSLYGTDTPSISEETEIVNVEPTGDLETSASDYFPVFLHPEANTKKSGRFKSLASRHKTLRPLDIPSLTTFTYKPKKDDSQKNLYKYCQNLLSSKWLHHGDDSNSFFCLQYLWSQFYYYNGQYFRH